MELLASNQPWNLLIFMAAPVIVAETLAISELYLLYTGRFEGALRKLNKSVGIIVGVYFVGIIVYLFINAVIPITQQGEWRGAVDVIAVGMYLLSGVSLILVALLELGLLARKKDERSKLALHVTFVALFLVLAHIAMIAGMVDPDIFQSETTSYTHPSH
jgi:hypothetical protein